VNRKKEGDGGQEKVVEVAVGGGELWRVEREATGPFDPL